MKICIGIPSLLAMSAVMARAIEEKVSRGTRGTRGLKSSKKQKGKKMTKKGGFKKVAQSGGKGNTSEKSSGKKGGGGVSSADAPLIPGVAPGRSGPKVILTGDIDYPPYSFLGDALTGFEMDGIGPDIARGLVEVCDIEVHVGQANWGDCWGDNEIGQGIANGWYHGCMTYTHTAGVRNRYVEFSTPILNDNAPAGIVARLDSNGQPEVNGLSNLNGLRVVDVIGWAPTSDTLGLIINPCTGERMQGFEIVAPTQDGQANDAALRTLLAGDADVMWIYSGQAELYSCANLPPNEDVPYDCTLWDGLGTEFAYIQSGLYDHAISGTTLAISKLGSGLKDVLDPCIEEFIQTESYYDICAKHDLVPLCFQNRFFPTTGVEEPTFNTPANELTTSCSDGYCACPPQ